MDGQDSFVLLIPIPSASLTPILTFPQRGKGLLLSPFGIGASFFLAADF